MHLYSFNNKTKRIKLKFMFKEYGELVLQDDVLDYEALKADGLRAVGDELVDGLADGELAAG